MPYQYFHLFFFLWEKIKKKKKKIIIKRKTKEKTPDVYTLIFLNRHTVTNTCFFVVVFVLFFLDFIHLNVHVYENKSLEFRNNIF